MDNSTAFPMAPLFALGNLKALLDHVAGVLVLAELQDLRRGDRLSLGYIGCRLVK